MNPSIDWVIKGGGGHPPPVIQATGYYPPSFEEAGASLTEAGEEVVLRAARHGLDAPFGARTIVHADAAGRPPEATDLAMKRALTAAKALVAHGVYPGAIEVVLGAPDGHRGVTIQVMRLASSF